MMNYLKYVNLGLMMVTPAIVGLLIGALLDRAFKSYPLFTLLFMVLGIMSGLWSVYKSLKVLE
jgi:F0F1-type ATP synthase assembly protein I